MSDTTKPAKEMVTITKAEYDRLLKDSMWLGYLGAAGVDNWQGIDEAIRMRREEEEDGDE